MADRHWCDNRVCALSTGNWNRDCSEAKIQHRSSHSLAIEIFRNNYPRVVMSVVINLIMEFEERATTAIHIRVKRFAETYFLLCDEYETVESLKGRLLAVLSKIKFELPKQEEPLSTDDIRLCIKNRVSY